MIQQQYDDELVKFSCMVEIGQEFIASLPILSLSLERRLGMNVSHYFRSSYTRKTEGYQWGTILYKVVPTGADNYLEEIDRY